ncbi:MAG: hypothetical protein CMI67_20990 [Pelagibaca sp.]|nr:hypothetical protein [Pelagibaca sp.]
MAGRSSVRPAEPFIWRFNMSNQEPDFEKSKKWHWIPLAGMAAAVAFALFAALYEDAASNPPNDAVRDVEQLK